METWVLLMVLASSGSSGAPSVPAALAAEFNSFEACKAAAQEFSAVSGTTPVGGSAMAASGQLKQRFQIAWHCAKK
jgi:hypothetical protein